MIPEMELLPLPPKPVPRPGFHHFRMWNQTDAGAWARNLGITSVICCPQPPHYKCHWYLIPKFVSSVHPSVATATTLDYATIISLLNFSNSILISLLASILDSLQSILCRRRIFLKCKIFQWILSALLEDMGHVLFRSPWDIQCLMSGTLKEWKRVRSGARWWNQAQACWV